MDKLLSDQTLSAGNDLVSANGQHRLAMQTDGNLVLYRINGTPKWASGTHGQPIGGAIMQGDGNLVMYDGAGNAVWSSGTYGNPGAFLVMQDDGNLVIYTSSGQPIWATGTNVTSQRVTGFQPSRNGFKFSNSFPHVPDFQLNFLGFSVAIGDAANGLCGGMVFAVRDLFEAGRLPGPETAAPASGPLFDFLAARLLDSFELPTGPLRYYHLMDPNLPDHETAFSSMGLAPHGRAWQAIVDEWPKLRAGLDAGKLMPMALILEKSADPALMGKNHQVLAWGYDLDGQDLSLRIYDPNFPSDDSRRVSLNIGNPLHTTSMRHQGDSATDAGEQVWCFFTQAYAFRTPPDVSAPAPAPLRRFTITNRTPQDQLVQIYNPGDLVLLAPLPSGEFTVGPNETHTWIFHNSLNQVRVATNGRPFASLVNPGDEIVCNQDNRAMVINNTDSPVLVRFYRADDRLRWVTLPNGEMTIPARESGFYAIPSDLNEVTCVINGKAETIGVAGTLNHRG